MCHKKGTSFLQPPNYSATFWQMSGVALSPETKIGGQIMRKMTKQPKVQELNESVADGENLTLLVAVEQIANLAEDSALSKEFFAKAKPCIDHLTQRLKITDTQAVILSVAASF